MRFRYGLVPAIHAFVSTVKVVDGRHKADHDGRVNVNGRWYQAGAPGQKENLRSFAPICLHLRSNSFFISTAHSPK
jgi:hypothetical protein